MSQRPIEEINEYNENTRRISQQYHAELERTFVQIETQITQKLGDAQTVKIGASQETVIISEFWQYYMRFSSKNLPNPKNYFDLDQDTAASKIFLLVRLVHELYFEHIYPPTFPFPIIQKSYRSSRTPRAKFFFIGDTHGSFIDLIKMVKFFVPEIERGNKEGYEVKIIFMGDYVDRNELDIHHLLLLFTFNLKYPNNVVLLRGNHEEMSINAHYGFGKHMMDNFSQMLFAWFNFLFKNLPLVAFYHCEKDGIRKSIMALHGGIPILVDEERDSYKIPQLTATHFNNRQIWIDDMDTVSQQILWNDPIHESVEAKEHNFFKNRRGIGYIFGEHIFREFCLKNNVDFLFRGHQIYSEGIHYDFDKRFITIVSTGNYSGKPIQARFVEVDSTDIMNHKVHSIQDLSDY